MDTKARNENNTTILLWILIAILATVNFLTGWMDGGLLNKLAPFINVLCLTLFTFIHGIRKYGTMRMIVFFLFTFAISWSYETCSILTGFPFGNYYYSDALGPKLWLVPLLIMPAYFTVCYLSWIIAHVLLDKFQASLNKMMVFAVPLIASFIMVMWDISMDPVRATISKTWVWEDGGVYFGVPFKNFTGWFLCVYTILQTLAFYLQLQLKNNPASDIPVLNKTYWLQPVLMYGILPIQILTLAIFGKNFEVKSLDNHTWSSDDIYRSMALVSMFTMLPITAIAVLKLFTSKEINPSPNI
jgi:putative membrane protein